MANRILIVAAHPDDEVLGCGGVMARHAANGDDVYVVIVTRGIPELFPPEIIETTRAELRKAHRILGVRSTQFLDFPAPLLDTVPRHKLNDAIGQVIAQIQPGTVYIHHHGDIHLDHQIIFHAALVACRPINGSPIRRLLAYETLSETEWASPRGDNAFFPTCYVDITTYLPRKLEAMACYESQIKAPPHARSLQNIEALARYRGATVSLEAAEAFMIVREILD